MTHSIILSVFVDVLDADINFSYSDADVRWGYRFFRLTILIKDFGISC